MWNKLMACSAVAIGSAFMTTACGTADDETNRAAGEQVDSDSAELTPDAPGQFCGGIGNIPCPQGYQCVDDPTDTCDPTTTGRDCSGTCVAAAAQFCGGFANLPCPQGYVCVDDPTDTCDPTTTGRDCGGICVDDPAAPARASESESESESAGQDCSKKDPAKRYLDIPRDQCPAAFFVCEEGTTPFFDDCGCGCVTEDPAARAGDEAKKDKVEKDKNKDKKGEACGSAVCGKGTYCCNASCSLCVPEGNLCTQQVCDSGTPCGSNTCGAGEFCCNESCGICAPLGGVCTQQICPPEL